MVSPQAIEPGQRIELNDGRLALVRFVGLTSFQTDGIWIGIELSDASGKNDGSVKGFRYFQCELLHGMFVRATGVKRVVEDVSRPQPHRQPQRPESRQSTGGASLNAVRSRPSIAGHTPRIVPSAQSRQSSPAKRQSLASSMSSRASTSSVISNSRPNPAVSTTRSREEVSTIRRSRPGSLIHRNSNASSVAFAHTIEGDEFTSAPPGARKSTTSSRAQSDTADLDADRTPKPTRHTTIEAEHDVSSTDIAKKDIHIAPEPQRSARINIALDRQVEELQTKIRFLEKKRLDDHSKIKATDEVRKERDRIKQERDRFESIFNKLQEKYKAKQQELNALQSQSATIEKLQHEHDTVLEEATLDREVAEEQCEVLRTEVVALKERNEEMAMELDVLRSENNELGREMTEEERSQQGWLQLERSNDRLREALMRLRDASRDQEAELKNKIHVLEQDAGEVARYKSEVESLQQALNDRDTLVQDLKQQLDLTQSSEELIEELSDRNSSLREQLDGMKDTIENLEGLNQLNDELIVNHVESEKQFQQELDYRDSVITEMNNRSREQQATIEQHESSVVKFRQAVYTLQADLEEMRASRQLSEVEVDGLAKRSRLLLDRNLKLHSSAAKIRNKTIDLELKQLEAVESTRHLSIIQHFLPSSYDTGRQSIAALLRMISIAFKAKLIGDQFKQTITNDMSLSQEQHMAAIEVIDLMYQLDAVCQRFEHHIDSCSVFEFTRYEQALFDLELVEKTLQSQIQAVRSDEVNYLTIEDEMRRSLSTMTHLASIHITESPVTVSDHATARAGQLNGRLMSVTLAFSKLSSYVTQKQSSDEAMDKLAEFESKESGIGALSEYLPHIVEHLRELQNQGSKLHRTLSDLRTQSKGIEVSMMQPLEQAEAEAEKAFCFVRASGQNIIAQISEPNLVAIDNIGPQNVIEALEAAATSTFHIERSDTTPLSSFRDLLQHLSASLTSLQTFCTESNHILNLDLRPEPWKELGSQMAATRTTNADAETEVVKLKDLISQRTLQVQQKDKDLSEMRIKTEFLEARMADKGANREELHELKRHNDDLEKQCAVEKTEVQRAAALAQRLRTERDNLITQLKDAAGATSMTASLSANSASVLELEKERKRTESLQATIRYLWQVDKSKPHLGDSWAWLRQSESRKTESKAATQVLLMQEGRDLLHELLNLSTSVPLADLTVLQGQDKLKWRPAKLCPAWTASKRREEWETWCQWQRLVLSKTKRGCGTTRSSRAPKDDWAGSSGSKFPTHVLGNGREDAGLTVIDDG